MLVKAQLQNILEASFKLARPAHEAGMLVSEVQLENI